MILGIGHPRTGTGFTSHLCKLWGLDVQHELMGTQGTSDWRYIKPEGPYPFGHTDHPALDQRPHYDTLVYNVRDPKTALGSIIYTEDMSPESVRYRTELFTLPFSNRIERSIASMVAFDDIMTEMNPDITYRIEDQQEVLFDGLSERGYDVTYVHCDTPVNTRPHLTLDDALLYYTVSPEHQILINNICDKYNYKPIEFKGGNSNT